MTERGAQLSIVGFWRRSMPPSPDATIIITILITERGRHYFFWDFGAPPYPDATILRHKPNYISRCQGEGAPISCKKLNI